MTAMVSNFRLRAGHGPPCVQNESTQPILRRNQGSEERPRRAPQQRPPSMRFVDLTAPIAPSPPDAPPYARVEVRYTSHAEGAAQIEALLGVTSEWLKDGEGWAVEEFTRLGTHA